MGLFDLFKGKKEAETQEFNGKVFAPISGKLLPLSEVPDEVFAQKMIGDGVAIEPSESGVMLAPADGKLEKIFETNHAFSIVTPSGLEIFVHFGMDTVKLEGKGFERLVNEGDVVKKGTIQKIEFLFPNSPSVLLCIYIISFEHLKLMFLLLQHFLILHHSTLQTHPDLK